MQLHGLHPRHIRPCVPLAVEEHGHLQPLTHPPPDLLTIHARRSHPEKYKTRNAAPQWYARLRYDSYVSPSTEAQKKVFVCWPTVCSPTYRVCGSSGVRDGR